MVEIAQQTNWKNINRWRVIDNDLNGMDIPCPCHQKDRVSRDRVCSVALVDRHKSNARPGPECMYLPLDLMACSSTNLFMKALGLDIDC